MTVDSVQSRTGVVTFKGKPMTLLGPELRAGDPAPAFGLTAADLSPVNLEYLLDEGQRAALLIVVPSLDTPRLLAGVAEVQRTLGRTAGGRERCRRQHGSAVRYGTLVRRARRRQAGDALRLPRSQLRLELRPADRRARAARARDRRHRQRSKRFRTCRSCRKLPTSPITTRR